MTFRTVEQFEAIVADQAQQIERLRAIVIYAYAEGFGDAWAIGKDHLNQVAEHDFCWSFSRTRAVLQPKEGEE